jgi:CRISPR-associated protein Cmr1
MDWKLKALTPIWTGDANGRPERLIPTGIMGSLRWWFEVLVRGLGGKACDPTAENVRCPGDNKKPHEGGHHCVVCELFGCTGWARKFRLMVLDDKGQVIQNQIRAGQTFVLRFIPLRPIAPEEWCLLDATLRLIADYGAIGGKTVFKPSDEPDRQNVLHHRDFGLVQYVQGPDGWRCNKTLEDIRAYVTHNRWRTNFDNSAFTWASLQNFWCVKGRYLARQDVNTSSFNFVIGRPEPKSQSSQGDSWLAGRRPNRQLGIEPESKKVFSFKEPRNACRTFGFVQSEQGFSQVLKRLNALKDGGNGGQPDRVWDSFNPDSEFLKGEQILERLFQWEEGA